MPITLSEEWKILQRDIIRSACFLTLLKKDYSFRQKVETLSEQQDGDRKIHRQITVHELWSENQSSTIFWSHFLTSFQVDLHNGSSSKSQNISGIFIKNVLPNSPAGRTGELKVTYATWILYVCFAFDEHERRKEETIRYSVRIAGTVNTRGSFGLDLNFPWSLFCIIINSFDRTSSSQVPISEISFW